MSATTRRVPLSHLLAALLIVAGLAMSAPPSCVCAPSEHFGLLLHPLFPHVHGDPHRLATWPDESSGNQQEPLSVERAPGISAGTPDTTAHEALGGILLPLFLAAALVEASRRLREARSRPKGRTLPPPSPPPRIALELA